MNETFYKIYKTTKRFIERTEECDVKDHDEEQLFNGWKDAVAHLDAANRGYAERYEQEKKGKQNESAE